MNNSAACRAVGVNRKTGTRWRYGRTVVGRGGRTWTYAAIAMPEASVSARFLSHDERLVIADRRLLGESVRTIAGALGRSPSTVSREIRRNSDPDSGCYYPSAAHRRAARRRERPKPRKLAVSQELREFAQRHLAKRWSPEQISGGLRAAFPGRPEMRVTHETTYQALYVQGRGELRRELARALRTGRTHRKDRRRPERRTTRFIDPMVMLSDRPAEADDRAVPGHWEGDLIMGTSNRSAIGTLVERTTRYVLLMHLPNGHNAPDVRDALVETISTLPTHLTRSLTWDQGIEMSRHAEFTIATDIPVFFCDPASPWQRGSSENTNGLLRQYFPKGTDLGVHSAEHLAAVAAELNGRPRKTLDWNSPAQRLATLLQPAP